MSRRSKKVESAAEGVVVDGPGRWGSLDPRVRHGICLTFLAVVSVSYFAPVHFQGKLLVGPDSINWQATAQSIIEYEQETGDFALWATNVFAGMPAYMISYRTVVPQLDTLLTALRRVFWPSSHFIVLLIGTYLLTFLLTQSNWSAVLSAVAFGFTTYVPVILAVGHNSKFIALALAPWLLLAFAFALRRPGVLSTLLFAICFALHLRAGHFQITYYVLFVMLVWWIAEGVSAVRSGGLRTHAVATLTLVAGGVLASLMVAQPYLSQFEYKAYTIRGSGPGGSAGGLAWDYAMGWSQGVAELLTLAIADAFGGSQAYWGPKTFTGGPHYLTALVLFLAAVGAVRDRSSVARSLGISALLLTAFSLGSNFALLNKPMFDYFPLFSAFRVPETWLAALALVAAVLAGIGAKSIVDNPPALTLRKPLQAVFAVFAGVLLFLALGQGTGCSFEKDGEQAAVSEQIARANNVSPQDPRVERAAEEALGELRQERQDRLVRDAWRSAIFLLLALGGFVLFARGQVPSAAFQAMIALLVLVDLWGVGRRYLGDENWTTRPLDRSVPEYAFDRYILEQRAADSEPFRVFSLEGSPSTTSRPSFYHESLSGYHGAKLRLYQDFLDRLLVTPEGRLNISALQMLNTRFVVARQPVPAATRVFDDEQAGMSVFELDDALPRAFFVDSVRVVATSEEAFEALSSPTFDPSLMAVTADNPGVPVVSRDSTSTPSARVNEYSPRHITIDVTTDRPRLLVVSEVFYPAGWYATIDSEPAEIHRVDYLLRGIVVPAGSRQVELSFEPRSHSVGVWISQLSTIAVYGLTFVIIGLGFIRTRRQRGNADVA